MDMIKAHLPYDLVVFHAFHIIHNLMGGVGRVRKEAARKREQEDPELLKKFTIFGYGTPVNKGLSDLEKLNLKINLAYLLKEAFRKYWHYRYPACVKK